MQALIGLKAKRKDKRLTREALGRLVDISAKSIYQYEIGNRFPSSKNWEKLTKFFNCSIDELITAEI